MNNKPRRAQTADRPPRVAVRLLDQLRERIRYLHYSLRTEQAYVHWNVSVSTHRQALSALLFLYREVLGMDLPWMNDMARPTARPRIPSVLTIDEVAVLLSRTEGETDLLARLLYGTDMRLMEGLRLRVKDLDIPRKVITFREAEGWQNHVGRVKRMRKVGADPRTPTQPPPLGEEPFRAKAMPGVSSA